MKWLAWFVAGVSVTVILLACTAVSVLSALDGVGVAVEPLMVGDLGQLLQSHTFWAAFPAFANSMSWFAPGPLVLVLGMSSVLLAVWLRWARLKAPVLALLVLLSGIAPYAVGAIALAGNTVAEAAGPWLAWMLLGPLYAALMALLWLAVGMLATRRADASAVVGQPAH